MMRRDISNRLFIAGLTAVAVCTFMLSSCRDLGDDLISYGQKDYYAFDEAEKNFTNQFKALWMAFNENYGIWDYEEQHGLNWDQVYTDFLPKFQALDDTTANKTKVTDEQLKALYRQFIDSLHEGHLVLEIQNLHTGNRFTINPSFNRIVRERKVVLQAEMENITDLNFYSKLPAADLYHAGDYDATSSLLIIAEEMDTVCSRLIRAGKSYVTMVDNAGGPNATNDSLYQAVKNLQVECQAIIDKLDQAKGSMNSLKPVVTRYNSLCTQYGIIAAQLKVAMNPIEAKMTKDGLNNIASAVFTGGIAYLRIGDFGLTPYLAQNAPADKQSMTYLYHQAVNRVWDNWFDTIQTLHRNGELGGVIIDVRNNGGGLVSDYQFVLGALLPSGGYASHYLRTKQGTGRLDFAPIIPFTVPTYPDAHAVIQDKPIVVLANSWSFSMSEMTTWGVKSQPNGYFVGTRTWGGLSALVDDPAAYSQTYSGCFGVDNVTPFYAYLPRFVSLFGEDMQILEGVGVTPDKEVALDVNYWTTQQRDNQLEAALDYIHSR